MATPPVFSTAQVLTAAQMNAVGMWLVKTVTIGSGVTSVPVTNCFSSDFTNYRIVVNTSMSASGNSAFITLNNSAGTTYFGGGQFQAYSTTTNTGASFPGVSDGFWCGISGPNFTMTADILRPNLAQATGFFGLSSESTYSNTVRGLDSNAASSVSMTLTQVGGVTMTGGQIRVYGYRD
jgi:hypothetical protein